MLPLSPHFHMLPADRPGSLVTEAPSGQRAYVRGSPRLREERRDLHCDQGGSHSSIHPSILSPLEPWLGTTGSQQFPHSPQSIRFAQSLPTLQCSDEAVLEEGVRHCTDPKFFFQLKLLQYPPCVLRLPHLPDSGSFVCFISKHGPPPPATCPSTHEGYREVHPSL